MDDDDEEFCRSHFEMIATKRLTSFERACLLCSLFRGFCLWSLVVLGTRKPSSIDSISEDHAWVVVINRDQHGAVKSYSFWEPMTGENCQQGQYQSTDGFHFENACLLFNDMELYANVNPNPNVNHCDWNVEDSQHWKSVRGICIDESNFLIFLYKTSCADGSSLLCGVSFSSIFSSSASFFERICPCGESRKGNQITHSYQKAKKIRKQLSDIDN